MLFDLELSFLDLCFLLCDLDLDLELEYFLFLLPDLEELDLLDFDLLLLLINSNLKKYLYFYNDFFPLYSPGVFSLGYPLLEICTLIVLSLKSVPFSYKAFFESSELKNFTNANPLEIGFVFFPSPGSSIIFT